MDKAERIGNASYDVPEQRTPDMTLRKAIWMCDQVNDEDGIMQERLQKHMVDICIQDIDSTIDFLDRECTAHEISWLSGIFDELVERTQSIKLVAAILRTIAKYHREEALYHNQAMLDDAVKDFGDFSLRSYYQRLKERWHENAMP